jgi:hypothetical protein
MPTGCTSKYFIISNLDRARNVLVETIWCRGFPRRPVCGITQKDQSFDSITAIDLVRQKMRNVLVVRHVAIRARICGGSRCRARPRGEPRLRRSFALPRAIDFVRQKMRDVLKGETVGPPQDGAQLLSANTRRRHDGKGFHSVGQ